MDVSAYKRKFKQLFDAILKDNIEISAYHSENILKHLDGSRDNCTEKILETPFFTELIAHALKNSNSATTSVKVFIVNIVSIVMRNEVHFNRFVHMGGFEAVAGKCRELPAALHLAYVQQGATLADHYSGLKYIMDQDHCRKLLQPYTHHRPPALARSIYDFISKLIWKLNEYDEEAALLDTLQFIVQPIATFDFESTMIRGLECEMAIFDQLITYLHTLVAVLGEMDNLILPNKVVPILMRFGVVESKLTAILEETREPALATLLGELGVRYHLAASLEAARRDPAAVDRANEDLNGSISKIISTLVKKRSIPTIMDFISKCHNYWYKVQATGHSTSFERFGRRYEMRDVFLMMLLVPLFTKCKAKQKPIDDRELQEAFEIFTYGVGQDFPHDMFRLAYSLRALVEETGTTNATCLRAVRELLRPGPGRLCRRQAVLVFQILFYALSEYVLSDGAGALVLLHNPLRAPDDEQLVGAVLDAIKMLLEEHDISWYESVEIINLQAALINLIKQNILPMKPLVQVLELMTLSVRKLLPPELALLLQSARGGSLREAGAAARGLLAHPEPRVRAAALAFIHSFAEAAYVKFVALRRVISEHALLAGAARAALGDPAARAQAAALRCLAAGARCHCLWAELLADHHDLYEQLMQIVQQGVDGEVRAEAAAVLTEVYVSRSVSGAFVRRVSRVMCRATADACPRAQLAALDFWRRAAATTCADRGMIDCRFPPVTFSKEKRKIITLTDEEIRKQLHAIMDSLSTSGYLGVLLKCLAPHNDLEVIEKAYEFASELVCLLEFYKFDVKPAQCDLMSEMLACAGAGEDPGDAAPEVVPPQVFIDTFKWTDPGALIKSMKLASGPADLDTLLDEVISLGHEECNKHTIPTFSEVKNLRD